MVLAGMFFDALEQDTTGAIIEGLKASFGMDTADLAFLNTIMIIGGLVGRLATGYLADIKGRRYALAFNLLLYTLGGLLSAVAPPNCSCSSAGSSWGSGSAASSPSGSHWSPRSSRPSTAGRSRPH